MKRLLLSISLLALFLAGCSSTQVEQVTSEKPEAAALQKVLVVGVNTTPEIQKVMEEAFSKRLSSSKRTVVLASDWFPGEKQPSRDQVAARAKTEGVTGVLVTRLINYEVTDVQENYPEFYFGLYTPGRTPDARVGWETDPWVRGFNNAQEIRENAPLVERKAVVETRLYNAVTGEVMWEAKTKTLLERDASRNFDGFVSAIMAQLRKSGWLK
ncbi:MAG: hypothetical protein REI12_13020 [Pedobacter sp.]|nr:hypothetical protein [Pedobacter sp.]